MNTEIPLPRDRENVYYLVTRRILFIYFFFFFFFTDCELSLFEKKRKLMSGVRLDNREMCKLYRK